MVRMLSFEGVMSATWSTSDVLSICGVAAVWATGVDELLQGSAGVSDLRWRFDLNDPRPQVREKTCAKRSSKRPGAVNDSQIFERAAA